MKKLLIGLFVISSLSQAFADSSGNISFPLTTMDGEGTYFTQTCNESNTNCRFDHDVRFHCDETSQSYLTLKKPRLFGSKTYKVFIKSRNECNDVEALVAETILSADTSNKPRQHVWISLSLTHAKSWLTGMTVEECHNHSH